MRRILASAMAVATLAGGMTSIAGTAMADPHHGRNTERVVTYDQYGNRVVVTTRHDRGRHNGWRRGQRMPAAYYHRSHWVDYRSHHLTRPPRGYQWVQVDNDYVLVALASGVISQLIYGG